MEQAFLQEDQQKQVKKMEKHKVHAVGSQDPYFSTIPSTPDDHQGSLTPCQ